MDFEAYRSERLSYLENLEVSELRVMLASSLSDEGLSSTDRDAVEADLSLKDDGAFREAVLERAKMRLDDLLKQMKP